MMNTIWKRCKAALSGSVEGFSGGRWGTLALATVCLGTLWAGAEREDEKDLQRLPVERSRLVVSVKESGTLRPVSETTLRNELSGDSRIIFLVPEGSYVEEGDLLVELDSSMLEDRLERRQLSLEKRQASLVAAESRLEIVESDAKSDLSSAKQAVEFARMDLEKFLKFERSNRLHEAKTDRAIAAHVLEISENRLAVSEQLSQEGYETQSTVDRDRLSMKSDKARLVRALNHEQMEQRFELVSREQQLRAKLVESEQRYDLAKRKTEGRLAQARANLTSAHMVLEVAQAARDEAQEELKAAKIYAPHGGMVVHGGSSSRHSRESRIEEGAQVRKRQSLVTLPDRSAMKLEVEVHETVASDVQEGQEAFVTLDSDPEKIYRGTVSQVALFPERRHFWSRSQATVYKTEITLNESADEIPPGASGKVQILLHYLEDVLTVPLAAVTTIEGQATVEVEVSSRQTETRPVELGAHNERDIHVISGLAEGETIVLREAS